MAAAAKKLKVIIFLGSTREGRLGERVSKFCKNYLEKTNHEVTVFDPIELDLPLLKKPLHFYKDLSEAPKKLKDCNDQIKAADAFLFVSCEYNHCIPPALANMVDHFPCSSFAWRPSGIVTYSPGIYGGVRCSTQLRALTGELGCISVSNMFGIPQVHTAIDENGKPLNDQMETGMKRLMSQLDWMAWAMKNQKEKHGIPM
ncbi:hypothetical protein CHS0354_020120 [Potamilus streckersoni]|uniref:NADPH-dependent FMN reductase-like domain-containing protein n=1 Tax=Potamilus streckersoni TaxID=2493646 RepID=A0AAE0VQF6_9BIVA|nr:hypothetical protein CHS0354_020120 [Potamilus streckersoni]